MTELKVGFIGAGAIANVHASRISGLKNVKIVAFADIVESKARSLAEKYGGRAYRRWEDMLEKESLDAIYVCIPPYAHRDEVIVAAEKNVHVFIEKPIALDLELAEEMTRAVEKAGIVSQVGYVWRFTKGIQRAKEVIERGELGRVGLFAARYLGDMLWALNTDSWWKDRTKSGGHVVEQATHMYDSLRYLLGEAVEVHAYETRFVTVGREDWTVEDAHVAILRMKNNAIAAIYSTPCAPAWLQGWLIVGEKGFIELPGPHTIEINYRGRSMRIREEVDGYLEESIEFFNAIRGKGETRAPIREGYKTLKLTLAVRKSMESGGKKVTIGE